MCMEKVSIPFRGNDGAEREIPLFLKQDISDSSHNPYKRVYFTDLLPEAFKNDIQ